MSLGFDVQGPTENKTWSIDWADVLGVSSIGSSAWAVDPSEGTVLSASGNGEVSGAIASVRLSGLVLGRIYALKNTVLIGSATHVRTINIRCVPT